MAAFALKVKSQFEREIELLLVGYTGSTRNKMPTSDCSRMRFIVPNEIKFEVPIIQKMRLT